MLRDINVTVAGNVTRAPEVKYRRVDQRPFTVIPIAVNGRRWHPEQQKYVDSGVTYYDIQCSGSLGANTLASLEVGTPVVAHGRFRIDEWTTDTMRGARPIISADSVGVDLSWGTASYTKGSRDYPEVEDGVQTSPPPESEGGPAAGGQPYGVGIEEDPDADGSEVGPEADENGVVSDEAMETYYARSA